MEAPHDNLIIDLTTGKVITHDLGGSATTTEFTKAIIEEVERSKRS